MPHIIRLNQVMPDIVEWFEREYNILQAEHRLLPFDSRNFSLMESLDALSMDVTYSISYSYGNRQYGRSFRIRPPLDNIQQEFINRATDAMHEIFHFFHQEVIDGVVQFIAEPIRVNINLRDFRAGEINPWIFEETKEPINLDELKEDHPNFNFKDHCVDYDGYTIKMHLTKKEISTIGPLFENCLGWNYNRRDYGMLTFLRGDSRKVCLCLTSGEAKAAKNAQVSPMHLTFALNYVKMNNIKVSDKFKQLYKEYL